MKLLRGLFVIFQCLSCVLSYGELNNYEKDLSVEKSEFQENFEKLHALTAIDYDRAEKMSTVQDFLYRQEISKESESLGLIDHFEYLNQASGSLSPPVEPPVEPTKKKKKRKRKKKKKASNTDTDEEFDLDENAFRRMLKVLESFKSFIKPLVKHKTTPEALNSSKDQEPTNISSNPNYQETTLSFLPLIVVPAKVSSFVDSNSF